MRIALSKESPFGSCPTGGLHPDPKIPCDGLAASNKLKGQVILVKVTDTEWIWQVFDCLRVHHLNACWTVNTSPKTEIIWVVLVECLVDASRWSWDTLRKISVGKRFRVCGTVGWHKLKVDVLKANHVGPIKPLRLAGVHSVDKRKPPVRKVGLREGLGKESMRQ